MNIFRVADEKAIPSWFAQDEPEENKTPTEEVEKMDLAEEVNDLVLMEECDKIEACSSDGKIYHYNLNWKDSAVSHLREYAIACGMDLNKFQGINPADLQKESSDDSMVKTAGSEVAERIASETETLKQVMDDPFNIEQRSDMSHMEPANWETVAKQQVLGEPTIDTGSVIAIGGGEDYFANSDVNPAANQNSITNPNAIEQLAESEVDDTGERLRKEREAKEAKKAADHAEWQKEKIAEMSQGDIIPKGTVFPTETLNANTGLEAPSSQMGIYANFNPESIPEKTAGEKIAEQNKEYKESIQRPQEQDDWQKPCKQSSRSISDSFGKSLEELLK